MASQQKNGVCITPNCVRRVLGSVGEEVRCTECQQNGDIRTPSIYQPAPPPHHSTIHSVHVNDPHLPPQLHNMHPSIYQTHLQPQLHSMHPSIYQPHLPPQLHNMHPSIYQPHLLPQNVQAFPIQPQAQPQPQLQPQSQLQRKSRPKRRSRKKNPLQILWH